MDNGARNLWAVYAEDAALFLRNHVISLGWGEMGDLSALEEDKALFRERFRETYPDETPVNRAGAGALLFRLIYEIRAGDVLVFPCGTWVYLGVVAGPYICVETLGQCRKVRWLKRLPKTDFSRDALREIGSSPTRLFAVKNRTWEFLSPLGDLGSVFSTPETSNAPSGSTLSGAGNADSTAFSGASGGGTAFSGASSGTLLSGASGGGTAFSSASSTAQSGTPVPPSRSAAEMLQERISATPRFILENLRKKLNRETFQDFAADLLRAMGHQVEEPSRRGGMDFLTVRDDMMPRLLVYPKAGVVQEADIALMERSLEGGQSGLILSLMDFSEEVRESLRTAPGLRGVAGTQLAELIIRYYSLLSPHSRRMIPLRTVYLPDL